MPISIGNVLDKISETRSKIAVLEGLVLHLKSNYLTSDTGEPEMRFYRGDYAPVPELHIVAGIGDIELLVKDLRAQLAQWEGITVEVEDNGPSGAPKKAKKAKEAAAAEDH